MQYNRVSATILILLQAIVIASGFTPPSIDVRYPQTQIINIPTSPLLGKSNDILDVVNINDNVIDINDEPCIVGENVVDACELPTDVSTNAMSNDISLQGSKDISLQGTQTKLSAATNLGKCICGAGSFALPHVFLNEGVLGGTIAMISCGYLAAITMQSINNSRFLVVESISNNGEQRRNPPTSYVELADMALGENAAKVVFSLTLAASLGVCSTYIVFVGQTLASLSADVESNNIIHQIAPMIDQNTWELITAGTVLPLSLIRNYGVFKFTSALGVSAVLGGILVTLAYGVLVDPGGGIVVALSTESQLKMWPDSFSDAFGGSFGTIAYLFCVNFLTFPIINSMKDAKNEYNGAVSLAVGSIWTVNIIFAIVCLGFYGDQTEDLVLQNLDNGPYLSALKILLCIDLLFTFPVVFSSGRQILENALIREDIQQKGEGEGDISLTLSRTAITSAAVATCYGLTKIGGFGVVANLIGGVAQGTLAFIIPPAIAIALSRRKSEGFEAEEIPNWLIASFGVAVVSSVTYFTLAESFT